MDQQLVQFFSQFEKANQSSDIVAIGALYGENFMFGGLKGVQTIQRDAFLKLIPKMRAYFSSMGLFERSVHSLEAQEINSKYALVKVGWRMGVQTSTTTRQIEVFASYILMRDEEQALSIVFQIDHQDLSAVIKSHRAVDDLGAGSPADKPTSLAVGDNARDLDP